MLPLIFDVSAKRPLPLQVMAYPLKHYEVFLGLDRVRLHPPTATR
jgi:hypothetical protein